MRPAMSASAARSRSRSAARLAAVQALYQQEMEAIPVAKLLHEFHHHRLGATIDGVEYADAEVEFFDDIVKGVDARSDELDGLVTTSSPKAGRSGRLDKPMRQILRAGSYELLARADVPTASHHFRICRRRQGLLRPREAGFVNGLLDAIAKDVRA
jgi:N utilization substance protein B